MVLSREHDASPPVLPLKVTLVKSYFRGRAGNRLSRQDRSSGRSIIVASAGGHGNEVTGPRRVEEGRRALD